MDLDKILKDYCEMVEINRARTPNKFEDVIHMTLGMITELGELADNFKKYIAYGKEIDWINVKEELGDIFWYFIGMCNVLGFTLEDIMDTNKRKLAKRYKNGFTPKEALNRNTDLERKELENGVVFFGEGVFQLANGNRLSVYNNGSYVEFNPDTGEIINAN